MEKRSLGKGRYTLIERLGEGAAKEVFLARDEALHRDVALCMFKPSMLKSFINRVETESRTLASLNHPNIIAIYDVLDDDGRYMITEYVSGGSLKSKMDRDWKGGSDLGEVTKIAFEVAGALSFTHAKGIFHRDVKPSNVMLTPEGTAKLGDFGMAKPFSDESISGTGAIEGTIPYMSPEQAKGLPPDSPSDMYSFGVTLYEMVTGRRPFHGEDVSVLLHHLNSIPPPPTRFMLACPPRLETLILNLLEKDPELRPSASSAEEELRSIRAEFLGERSEPIVPISAIPGANDEDDGEIEIPSLESLQVGRLSDALQFPSTVVPLFVAALALMFLILPLPGFSAIASIIVIVGAGSIAAASFVWRYFVRYGQDYAIRMQELFERQEHARRAQERRALRELRDTLRTGFTSIKSSEGVRSLNRLVNEYEQLQAVVRGWPEPNLVPIGQIPILIGQTSREGLDMLYGVLYRLQIVDTSDKKGLEAEVETLERDILLLKEDETQAELLKIREAMLSARNEHLRLLSSQELRAAEFLLRSSLIESSLNRTRIELASLRIDGSKGSVSAVVEALQRTIDQARKVMEEMRDLGF